MGLGGTLPAVILAVFLTQLFWRFGIHGTLLVNCHIIPPKCQNNGLLLPYQFNGANADTAGLIGDFQSARISLEELN